MNMNIPLPLSLELHSAESQGRLKNKSRDTFQKNADQTANMADISRNTIPTLLKRQQVEQITSVGRSHLYAMMTDGKFPRPVNLSAGRVAWLASEVHDWILARISERDGSADNAF